MGNLSGSELPCDCKIKMSSSPCWEKDISFLLPFGFFVCLFGRLPGFHVSFFLVKESYPRRTSDMPSPITSISAGRGVLNECHHRVSCPFFSHPLSPKF